MRLTLNAGCDTSAATEDPATTMLTACAIVTMLDRKKMKKRMTGIYKYTFESMKGRQHAGADSIMSVQLP